MIAYRICLPDEFVAHSVDGFNMFRLRRVALQFRAEPGDVIVHGAAGRITVVAPDSVQQIVARHDLTRSGGQIAQRWRIPCASFFERCSAAARFVTAEVDLSFAELQIVGKGWSAIGGGL